MQLDSDHFDVVVLGTGLAESIAAAALAKAGRSVLHLDPNHYYGGEQASLTLDELAEWAGARSRNLGTESLLSNLPSDSTSSQLDSGKLAEAGPSNYLAAQRARYTRASTTPLSPSLQADKRRYAISLFPALMPSRGALVGTLIASDVSKYVTFKLLDGVHVWTGSEEQTHRVPGSKEDVFKDKSVSLPDKRKLMKALMFAGGDFEQDPALQGKESDPLLPFLQSTFGLSTRLAEALTYAVAHGSADEPALPALQRARRYLRSIGRYGPSAFLIGQFGGAGEVAQGFCRACAVFGGTYILGPEASPSDISVGEQVSLRIPGHPNPVTAGHLITSPDFLPRTEQASTVTTAHMVALVTTQPAVLKRRTQDEETTEDDDTAVVVFPSDSAPTRALIMGEGTGSCPAGQWVVYLWSEATEDSDPKELLQSALDKIAPEGAVYQAAYLQHREETKSTSTNGALVELQPYSGSHVLTEGLDWEAEQAQKAFNAVVGEGEEQGFFEKAEDEEEEDEE